MKMLDLTEQLSMIKKKDLYRRIRSFASPQGPKVLHGGKEFVNLCSNNYLGIAGSPELTEAAMDALGEWGVGTGGSRLIGGTTELHSRLEEMIALFKGEEAALAFNNGYTANISTIPSLTREGMTIYSDSLNHASIIDGCRLSCASVKIYEHGNIEELERLAHQFGEGMIITDGIFSMTGEVAKLGELGEVANRHGLSLYVDDAHATGILGNNGIGTTELFNVKADINMGTLSKAVGAQGGFVAGSKELIDYLVNTARGFIYSTSFPAAWAAAATKGLEICKEKRRRDCLFENIRYIKDGLIELGFAADISGIQTPIIPVVLGDNRTCLRVARSMFERGVYCNPIRYPTVPEGRAMLRMTVMATHTEEDLDTGLSALKEGMKEVAL